MAVRGKPVKIANNAYPAIFVILVCLLMLLLKSCAVRRAPSGGPADKTAPVLISSFPAADSVNVGDLPFIELSFDEPLKRSSVRNEIWLRPELPTVPELQWKGDRTIRIPIERPLLPDQTYILTIGTGIQDLRGNSLRAPIVVPFSTGAHIDRGAIEGRVYAESVDGIFVYAYVYSDTLADTVVATRKPRYYTQVDKDGAFTVNYLKAGIYRLFALRDQNGNGTYDFHTDEIGIPSRDVLLDSTGMRAGSLNFRLQREDTIPPALQRIKRLNHRQLDILFDEKLDSLRKPRITIQDSATGKNLEVLGAAPIPTDQSIMRVYTALQSTAVYLGKITGIGDEAGNMTRNALPFRFSGMGKEDTTRFGLDAVKPRNGARRVSARARLNFFWSLPVDTQSAKSALSVRFPDSSVVSGRWQWKTPLQSQYIIADTLVAGGTYSWQLNLPQVRGKYGEIRRDSLRTGTFTVVNNDDLGEISGRISMPGDSAGQFIVTVSTLRKQVLRSASIMAGHPYMIPRLPEGKYQLNFIHDRDRDGLFDSGGLLPFSFAEPFLTYPDTVVVRKRWTTEGIDLLFSP